MSGRLTLFGAGEILTTYFSRASVPPPSFYLALIVAIAPTPYISGNELDEPTTGGYARAEIPNEVAWWANEGTVNVVTNDQDIVFNVPTQDWGTIRYWAVLNAATGGDPVLVGQMESPQVVVAGEAPSVAAGELDIELGPFFASWEV